MSGPSLVTKDEIREDIAKQLGVQPNSIDGGADLIELGLDSIRTMKLAGGWRKRGYDVNFAVLAAEPTVEAWHAALVAGAPEGLASPDPAPPATTEPVECPVGAGEAFALAPMQHAYWIGRSESQELGGVAAHLYVEFDGAAVDPDRLRGAVDRLVRRHPMLRAQFLPDGTQRILDEPRTPVFTVCDLRETGGDVDARLEELRQTKTHQRMDVDSGQVIDVTLTLLPGGRSRLHLDVDMLAADAMSYRILTSDLAKLYAGADLGPDLTFTFADYLRTRAESGGPTAEADRAWWAQRLPELPDAPALPVVPESERADPGRTVRYHHWLDADGKARLLDAAHRQKVTPAMALASVFAETIGHWSATPQFLLNLPLFHRESVNEQVDSLVGDFTSSVLLDVDVSAAASVLDRARALQRTMYDNGAHAGCSGLDVLRDLGRHRGEPVIAPIVYTSALGLGELFGDEVTAAFGEPVWFISQGPQVLLDAQVTEVGGGLLLNWDVREQAFPAGVIDTMFAEYTAAVDALGAAETNWSAEARRGLPAEQLRDRAVANDTGPGPRPATLHEGFFARAAMQPDAVALRWDGGQLDYAALAARALAVAGALADAGVAPGEAVAIQLPKGPDQVVAALGVLAAGGVYVPIGHDQPPARRDQILDTAGARVLLGGGEPLPENVTVLDFASAAAHPRPASAPVVGDPEDIAYVLFTSGSTGTPKGVEVPHRAAMNTIGDLIERFAIGPDDRALAISALEFDLSVFDVFALLSAGGSIVAMSDADRADPQRWAALVREHGVSILNCVPSILDMLLSTGGFGSTLRAVLLGGDWVGVDLPTRLRAVAPGCRFAGLGGTTETAIHSTICEVTGPVPAQWKSVPYGQPLSGVRCRVVDPTGRDCPDWVGGELWIGGGGVARGYRGEPQRTADRFVDHAGERWYRTGDLARYLPGGDLEFLGRADSQVKIRGYRVELGEIEAALHAVDEVHRALAVAIGGAHPTLAAAVTLTARSPEEAAVQRITDSLAERLPAYMVPENILVLGEFPLTPNGKLDRKAVRRLLDDGDREREYVAPRNDLERALAQIVAEVLRRERVGVTDDFFGLGADSVLATTAIARIREWLDAPAAAVSDIFAARNIAALAVRLDAGDERPGRLAEVATVYLEVAGMDESELELALAQSDQDVHA